MLAQHSEIWRFICVLLNKLQNCLEENSSRIPEMCCVFSLTSRMAVLMWETVLLKANIRNTEGGLIFSCNNVL